MIMVAVAPFAGIYILRTVGYAGLGAAVLALVLIAVVAIRLVR
jgi:hypothetical protein